MRFILLLSILFVHRLTAQEISGADQKTIEDIKKTINYLADDKLEGRRTGSAGEKKAYEFIISEFKSAGLTAMNKNGSYLQAFEVNDGKEPGKKNHLTVGNTNFVLNEDYFPMPYSANGTFSLTDLAGKKFAFRSVFLNDYNDSAKNNPHFDLKETIVNEAKDAYKKGAAAFFIFDSSSVSDKFDAKDKTPSLEIPVFYFTSTGTKKFFNSDPKQVVKSFSVDMRSGKREGHNVIGFIDNHMPYTIVIGAHYDHLGYGEDHNSLYVGDKKMVHNGADDNASGIAALIELGKWLKKSSLNRYNFTLIAFSGEELGLYGSKYFVDNSTVDLSTINCMLNMDMVGRLNDSTHGLNVGGYGTSPAWNEIIKKQDSFLKIKTDSSGTGPSDHTSFYKKDIPVLYFFTGSHSDYHKPSDDADKINFIGEMAVINYIKQVIEATNQKEKLPFTKTRETGSGTRFKVSIGIMPDYTFEGDGVKVDAVIDNRPAQKAGIKTGDVLYQLGNHPFHDVETYMQALNKFNKGEAAKIKLRRGKEELEFNVVF